MHSKYIMSLSDLVWKFGVFLIQLLVFKKNHFLKIILRKILENVWGGWVFWFCFVGVFLNFVLLHAALDL